MHFERACSLALCDVRRYSTSTMRTTLSLTAAFLSVFPFIQTAVAASFVDPGNNHVFVEEATDDDLYLFGETVQVVVPVGGDIIGFGQTIDIDEPVEGDVMVAGRDVSIYGNVGDDVRAAGAVVRILGEVQGDVIVAGGSVTIGENAIVHGDLLVGAGDAFLNGTVLGNMKVSGGRIFIDGSVAGKSDLAADDIDINGQLDSEAVLVGKNITLGDDALFGAGVRYWNKDGQIDFGQKVVTGEAFFDSELAPHMDIRESKMDEPKTIIAALLGIVLGYSVLSAALFILILLLVSKTFFADAGKLAGRVPAVCFIAGLLYFLVLPCLTLAFVISLIGLPIALALGFIYVLSLIFAKSLTAIVIVEWMKSVKKWKWGLGKTFFASVGVFIVLKLIALLPIIGWLALIVLVCIGMGAIVQVKFEKFKKVR